jgi:hypothetical protein
VPSYRCLAVGEDEVWEGSSGARWSRAGVQSAAAVGQCAAREEDGQKIRSFLLLGLLAGWPVTVGSFELIYWGR